MGPWERTPVTSCTNVRVPFSSIEEVRTRTMGVGHQQNQDDLVCSPEGA